jgi:O-antigen/teichoic acid export membrane protein
LFTYPSTVLNMTFGPEYAGGALSLTILAVGFFAHAIAGPSGNALAAIGKTRSMMYDNATVLAINLGLNVVLVPRWGIVGAAVATTVGYGVLNGLYLGQLYLATGMQPFTAATVKVGGAGAIFWTGIAYGGAQLGVADVLRSGLVFGAFCALYSIVILRFGNIGERELSVLKTVETRTGLQLGILRSLAKQFIR